MTGHSPGPWRIEECECSDSGTRWSEWAVTSAAGPVCAEVFTEANAHLIAAAPELLEALRAFAAGTARALGAGQVDVVRARSAIFKAEGRQP